MIRMMYWQKHEAPIEGTNHLGVLHVCSRIILCLGFRV
jgi:hypothetical protein